MIYGQNIPVPPKMRSRWPRHPLACGQRLMRAECLRPVPRSHLRPSVCAAADAVLRGEAVLPPVLLLRRHYDSPSFTRMLRFPSHADSFSPPLASLVRWSVAASTPGSCSPGYPSRAYLKAGSGSPTFSGNPHLLLPPSQTPAVRGTMALALGVRPHLNKSEDYSNGTFEAQSRGFGSCCLRFMPALLLTMQDSLLVGCQPLPGGSYTHRIPMKSFRLCSHHSLLLGAVAQY